MALPWSAGRSGGSVVGSDPAMTTLADQLLPEGLWRRIQPLLPPAPSHARGGAPRTVSDRACMAAILFMAHLHPVGAAPGP